MSDDQTILVKKADGTFVRMPLADVQKMQTGAPAADPAVAAPMATKPKEEVKAAPKTASPAPLLHHTRPEHKKPEEKKVESRVEHPGKEKVVPKPKMEKPQPLHVTHAKKSTPLVAPIADDDEEVPLLSETLPTPQGATAPRTSEKRELEVDEIIGSLSFKVSLGNGNRFRTIVQLFLKDIRNAEQTRDLLMRKEIDGGLGLTGEQAAEVLKKAGYQDPLLFQKTPPSAPKEGVKFSKAENNRLEKELPAVVPLKPKMPVAPESSKPSFVAPVKTVPKAPVVPVVPQPIAPKKDTKALLDDVVTKATMADAPILPQSFKLRPDAKQKTTMADVTVKPVEMTPVDEIKFFTLTDFRRLSTDPMEAAKRLKQKFINLKDESILLYFEALDAWKSAPLYMEYIALVSDALGKRQPVTSVAQDKNRIQVPEIAALVQMEKELQ